MERRLSSQEEFPHAEQQHNHTATSFDEPTLEASSNVNNNSTTGRFMQFPSAGDDGASLYNSSTTTAPNSSAFLVGNYSTVTYPSPSTSGGEAHNHLQNQGKSEMVDDDDEESLPATVVNRKPTMSKGGPKEEQNEEDFQQNFNTTESTVGHDETVSSHMTEGVSAGQHLRGTNEGQKPAALPPGVSELEHYLDGTFVPMRDRARVIFTPPRSSNHDFLYSSSRGGMHHHHHHTSTTTTTGGSGHHVAHDLVQAPFSEWCYIMVTMTDIIFAQYNRSVASAIYKSSSPGSALKTIPPSIEGSRDFFSIPRGSIIATSTVKYQVNNTRGGRSADAVCLQTRDFQCVYILFTASNDLSMFLSEILGQQEGMLIDTALQLQGEELEEIESQKVEEILNSMVGVVASSTSSSVGGAGGAARSSSNNNGDDSRSNSQPQEEGEGGSGRAGSSSAPCSGSISKQESPSSPAKQFPDVGSGSPPQQQFLSELQNFLENKEPTDIVSTSVNAGALQKIHKKKTHRSEKLLRLMASRPEQMAAQSLIGSHAFPLACEVAVRESLSHAFAVKKSISQNVLHYTRQKVALEACGGVGAVPGSPVACQPSHQLATTSSSEGVGAHSTNTTAAVNLDDTFFDAIYHNKDPGILDALTTSSSPEQSMRGGGGGTRSSNILHSAAAAGVADTMQAHRGGAGTSDSQDDPLLTAKDEEGKRIEEDDTVVDIKLSQPMPLPTRAALGASAASPTGSMVREFASAAVGGGGAATPNENTIAARGDAVGSTSHHHLSSLFLGPSAHGSWFACDMESEFERQELNREQWRISHVNARFDMCKTYPTKLVVPSRVDDQLLGEAAQLRSKNRALVVTYYHKSSGAALVRASQPLASDVAKRTWWSKTAVSDVLSALQSATPYDNPPQIIDLRPELNAKANFFKGGGCEGGDVLFQRIGNIQDVTTSFKALFAHVHPMNPELTQQSSPGEQMIAIAKTRWLDIVHSVLVASVTTARCLTGQQLKQVVGGAGMPNQQYNNARSSPSVGGGGGGPHHHSTAQVAVVHCTDGWDRTAQVCTLTQMLLDPFFRTIKGFCVLVDKDFVQFGHQFRTRSAFYDPERSARGDLLHESAPIFIMLLDCVSQLLRIYPTAFEFNEDFLIMIADCFHSGVFGNFAFNSYAEMLASKAPEKTVSLWTFIEKLFMFSTGGLEEYYSNLGELVSEDHTETPVDSDELENNHHPAAGGGGVKSAAPTPVSRTTPEKTAGGNGLKPTRSNLSAIGAMSGGAGGGSNSGVLGRLGAFGGGGSEAGGVPSPDGVQVHLSSCSERYYNKAYNSAESRKPGQSELTGEISPMVMQLWSNYFMRYSPSRRLSIVPPQPEVMIVPMVVPQLNHGGGGGALSSLSASRNSSMLDLASPTLHKAPAGGFKTQFAGSNKSRRANSSSAQNRAAGGGGGAPPLSPTASNQPSLLASQLYQPLTPQQDRRRQNSGFSSAFNQTSSSSLERRAKYYSTADLSAMGSSAKSPPSSLHAPPQYSDPHHHAISRGKKDLRGTGGSGGNNSESPASMSSGGTSQLHHSSNPLQGTPNAAIMPAFPAKPPPLSPGTPVIPTSTSDDFLDDFSNVRSPQRGAGLGGDNGSGGLPPPSSSSHMFFSHHHNHNQIPPPSSSSNWFTSSSNAAGGGGRFSIPRNPSGERLFPSSSAQVNQMPGSAAASSSGGSSIMGPTVTATRGGGGGMYSSSHSNLGIGQQQTPRAPGGGSSSRGATSGRASERRRLLDEAWE